MASTITPATLNVTIREACTLNGTDYGAVTRYAVDGVTQISRRIVATHGTGSTELLRFHPSASAGQYISGDVRYVRITNLDDTNYATLRIMGQSATDYSFRLDPTGSHLIMTTQPSSSSNSGLTSYADISGLNLTNVKSIKAIANTSAINLELFVASE
tara:strand:- start:296 stop:769 length:474 start_codon:yes stop_codon:yes gene_type:complete